MLRGLRTAHPVARAIEFDTFSVAVGLAIISGALAVLAPYLDALTGALVALGGAGWVAGHSLEPGGLPGRMTSARTVGLVSVGLGVGAFFLLSGPLGPARGLALALSFVPLWLIDRKGSPGPAAFPRGNR